MVGWFVIWFYCKFTLVGVFYDGSQFGNSASSAWFFEYFDCISAEGQHSPPQTSILDMTLNCIGW